MPEAALRRPWVGQSAGRPRKLITVGETIGDPSEGGRAVAIEKQWVSFRSTLADDV